MVVTGPYIEGRGASLGFISDIAWREGGQCLEGGRSVPRGREVIPGGREVIAWREGG